MAGIILLIFALVNYAVCIEDDCSKNIFDSGSDFMHFTKEPTNEEFAVVGKMKGLNCCAKGYRSIEWQKDGRSYPWPSATSGLIVYPESANQTIYAKTVTADDAGNYTCVLINDTRVIFHTVNLKVFDKNPDYPKITYLSKDEEVTVGHRVRLFCEAFVGVIALPDAHSEVTWRRLGDNGSIDDDPRVRQEKSAREQGQTFGAYLTIDEVTNKDFGQYICRISKPGGIIELLPVSIKKKVPVEYLTPNPVPWKKMLICVIVFTLVLATLLILNRKFGLAVRVRFKDRFGTIEDNDGKNNDALIAYSYEDSDLVLGVLLPTLESQYNYKCATREFPNNINIWCESFTEASKKSRRLIAVLSPAAVNNQWDTSTVYEALKQLNTLDTNLMCVALHDFPKNSLETKNSEGETLASLLRTIPVITWNRQDNERFWLSLRLRLPSRRHPQDLNMTQSNNSRRLTADSQDSLDVLV